MDGGFQVSPLVSGAIAMHEVYTELRTAGFTQDEALSLIVKLAKESDRGR